MKLFSIGTIFVGLFAVLCVLSAVMGRRDYQAWIVRRDTWVRGFAEVVKQTPGDRDSACHVAFRLAHSGDHAGGAATVSSQDGLDTAVDCARYRPGSRIMVHYPAADPARMRLFLHPDDTNEDRIATYVAQSVLLDLIFGLLCWFFCIAAQWTKSQVFSAEVRPKTSEAERMDDLRMLMRWNGSAPGAARRAGTGRSPRL